MEEVSNAKKSGSNEAENLLDKGIKKKKKFVSQEEKERAIFEAFLCRRIEQEKSNDSLLSGTSATLVIQTNKKIYVGWVGDTLVALQGNM